MLPLCQADALSSQVAQPPLPETLFRSSEGEDPPGSLWLGERRLQFRLEEQCLDEGCGSRMNRWGVLSADVRESVGKRRTARQSWPNVDVARLVPRSAGTQTHDAERRTKDARVCLSECLRSFVVTKCG